MKKILVIGCCGAGKSTLSKKLSDRLGLPIIHLDKVYWKLNWIETPKDEFEKEVTELMQNEVYVMDGNYSSTLSMRIKEADTLIYLDYPTWLCFWRVIKRIIKHYGSTREDMTKGCNERFDLEFLHYVLAFRWIVGTRIEKILKKGDYLAKVIRLSNDKAVAAFLQSI
jgi:adenylate kinase family enzyme